jgi:hypothetical protein
MTSNRRGGTKLVYYAGHKLKGDVPTKCESRIGGKERRAKETRVSHLSKGRHALWMHVSYLLNMQKKNTCILFFTGFSLC